MDGTLQLAAAQEGLQAQFGKPAAMVGSGGSIPVAACP